jgi:hypothetical protein
MLISAREICTSRPASRPHLDLFHRGTPLSWAAPGPEALRPSITAGLPLFGRVVSTVLYRCFCIGLSARNVEKMLSRGRVLSAARSHWVR